MRKGLRRKAVDPMAWIAKRTPLADDQSRDLAIAFRIALQAMLCGHGTEQAWSTLACALNVALIMSESNDSAVTDTIKAAQDALMRSRERAQRTGKWAFDGEGSVVIKKAFELHEKQLEGACTRGQITQALREVHRRIEIGEVMVGSI